MRIPAAVGADTLSANEAKTEINGKWVAARWTPYHSWKERWLRAWHVFTGKADALYWYKQ